MKTVAVADEHQSPTQPKGKQPMPKHVSTQTTANATGDRADIVTGLFLAEGHRWDDSKPHHAERPPAPPIPPPLPHRVQFRPRRDAVASNDGGDDDAR